VAVSIEFTEEMKGFLTFGEMDYQRGREEGEKNNTPLMFHLTIKLEDVSRFISDAEHPGRADGYIRCPQLGDRDCLVENGLFNLFVPGTDANRKLMLYRLFSSDEKGQPFTLSGFKDVADDAARNALEIWKDTSTLYTRILRGHVSEPEEKTGAETLASGIINILKLDFLEQLTTFKTSGGTLEERTAAQVGFGKLFLGSLWEVYGSKFKL
jgi:cholesterol oxidase